VIHVHVIDARQSPPRPVARLAATDPQTLAAALRGLADHLDPTGEHVTAIDPADQVNPH
jgi:hypothetical protein